jgi:hypothetical protein
MSTQALPFTKIPLDISFVSKAKKGKHFISYGAIAYHRVLGMPFEYRYLKELMPDSVRYVEIVGDAQVSPHRDHVTKTALNCYFESGDAITHFWREKLGANPIRFPGAATSNIFKNDDLDYIASFKAKDGDTYLLDVSTIHSVVREPPMKDRRFIQLSWRNATFDEVIARLKNVTG